MDRGKVIVMLDNGHAAETLGKRSPLFDSALANKYGMKQFREYWYNREIVSMLILQLGELGIEVYDVVPEEVKDISLTTRANRANNKYYSAVKQGKTAIFISVHVNAPGNGKEWKNAMVGLLGLPRVRPIQTSLPNAFMMLLKKFLNHWAR